MVRSVYFFPRYLCFLEIIEDVTNLAENARGRLDNQTEAVARLGDEKGTCYLWGIVIALFFVIMILISLP